MTIFTTGTVKMHAIPHKTSQEEMTSQAPTPRATLLCHEATGASILSFSASRCTGAHLFACHQMPKSGSTPATKEGKKSQLIVPIVIMCIYTQLQHKAYIIYIYMCV